MAEHKLTTICTFSDNTQSGDNSDLQEYVNNIARQTVKNWDTAAVTLEIDGDLYHAHMEGNEHVADDEYAEGVIGNPWHDCHKTKPPHDGNVLLVFSDEPDETDWDFVPAYWRDGEFYSGWNAVTSTGIHKNAYWRYINAPKID